jgi:hypothetical protein
VRRKNFRKNGAGLRPRDGKFRLREKRRDIPHLLHVRNAVPLDSHQAKTNAPRKNVDAAAGICASQVALAVSVDS